MTNSKLQQGISILYDMEINHYCMVRAIRSLDQEILRLGRKRNIKAPVKESTQGFVFISGMWGPIWGAGIMAGVLGIGWPISNIINADGFFEAVFGALFGFVGGLISGAVIGAIGGLIVGIVGGIIGKIIVNRKNEEKHKQAMKKYLEAEIADDLRVQHEWEKQKSLRRQRNILSQRYEESQRVLKKLYDKMEIDENFRHIIPIGYMYEFSRLVIATQLGGIKRLYDRVREEMKMDDILRRLDEISDKLDVIINNQRALHSELIAINQKCDRMVQLTLNTVQNTESIVCNTAVTAYNTERIQKELEYQNFMMLYSAV